MNNQEGSSLGYIEQFIIPKSCTMKQPECPIFYDPIVNGWECRFCGRSGPL